MALFKDLEAAEAGTTLPLDETLKAIPFNDQGLIPAVAQDADSGEVLMLAWVNREAIERSLQDGYATYFSRSRGALWRKGETSGNTQALVSMHLDCDGDALLMKVLQQGPACHTERPHCFYLRVEAQGITVTSNPT